MQRTAKNTYKKPRGSKANIVQVSQTRGNWESIMAKIQDSYTSKAQETITQTQEEIIGLLDQINSRYDLIKETDNGSSVRCIALSGRKFCYGTENGKIFLKELLANGELRVSQNFNAHQGKIFGLAMTQKSSNESIGERSKIISCSEDKTVRVWRFNPSTNVYDEFQTLTGHTRMVMSVAISKEGDVIVTGGEDNTVAFWKAPREGQRYEIIDSHPIHTKMVFSVAITGDGQLAASGSLDEKIKIFQYKGLNKKFFTIQTLDAHTNAVYCLKFTNNGQNLLSGSGDKTIRFWSKGTQSSSTNFKLDQTVKAGNTAVLCLDSSESGSIVVAGLSDGRFITLRINESSRQNEISESLLLHSDKICAIGLIESQYLVTGSADRMAKVCRFHALGSNYHDGRVFDVVKDMITSVEISKTESTVAFGSRDGSIAILKMDNNTKKMDVLDILENPGESVQGISLDATGDILVAAVKTKVLYGDMIKTLIASF